METQPNESDLEITLRQNAIVAGMLTIRSFEPEANNIPAVPDIDTVLIPRTVGTEFLEEVTRPWPVASGAHRTTLDDRT